METERQAKLCLPGGGKTLTNEEFSTTAAVNLCLPPPCLTGQVGEPSGGRFMIDEHGDSVESTNIARDHFRKRHNYIKMTLYNL